MSKPITIRWTHCSQESLITLFQSESEADKEVASLYRDCVIQNESFRYERLAWYISLDIRWCVLRILMTTSIIFRNSSSLPSPSHQEWEGTEVPASCGMFVSRVCKEGDLSKNQMVTVSWSHFPTVPLLTTLFTENCYVWALHVGMIEQTLDRMHGRLTMKRVVDWYLFLFCHFEFISFGIYHCVVHIRFR